VHIPATELLRLFNPAVTTDSLRGDICPHGVGEMISVLLA
jgi:hypothetical protein